MDKIFLSALSVECVVGIWEWERRVKQTVIIDVELAAEGGLMFLSREFGVHAWDLRTTDGPHPVNDWYNPDDIAAAGSEHV